jgi:hypothetical protein
VAKNDSHSPARELLSKKARAQLLAAFPGELVADLGTSACDSDDDCSDVMKHVCLKCPVGELVFTRSCREPYGYYRGNMGRCEPHHMLGAWSRGQASGCARSTSFCAIELDGDLVVTSVPNDASRILRKWKAELLRRTLWSASEFKQAVDVESVRRRDVPPHDSVYLQYSLHVGWVTTTVTDLLRMDGDLDASKLMVTARVAPPISKRALRAALNRCDPRLQPIMPAELSHEINRLNHLTIDAEIPYATTPRPKDRCKSASVDLTTGELYSCYERSCYGVF